MPESANQMERVCHCQDLEVRQRLHHPKSLHISAGRCNKDLWISIAVSTYILLDPTQSFSCILAVSAQQLNPSPLLTPPCRTLLPLRRRLPKPTHHSSRAVNAQNNIARIPLGMQNRRRLPTLLIDLRRTNFEVCCTVLAGPAVPDQE